MIKTNRLQVAGVIQGPPGNDGNDGKSAYQIALDNGFHGTEEEWIASLKGDIGPAGQQGEQGIPGQKGEPGEKGDPGQNGMTPYEYAVQGGYEGTEEEFRKRMVEDHTMEYAPAIVNTASGSSQLVITDSAERRIKDFKIFGNSVQATTTGKNLLSNKSTQWQLGKKTSWSAYIGNPIQYAQDTTSAIINIDVMPSQKYSFLNLQKNKIWVNRIIETDNQDQGLINHSLYGSEELNKDNYSFVTNMETSNIIFQIKKVDNTAITEDDIEQLSVMFYEGENLPYEPYTGGQPSPSPEYPQEIRNVGKYNEETGKYEVDVKVTGKNLFDREKAKISGWKENTSNGYATFRIFVGKNKKVTISYTEKMVVGYGFYLGVNLYHEQAIHKWMYHSTAENLILNKVTVTSTEDYIYLCCNVSSIDIMLDLLVTLQVEIGENQTEYEPYKEQTIKLSLDQPLRGNAECSDEVTQNGVVRKIYSQAVKKEQISSNNYNWDLKNFRCYVKSDIPIENSENHKLISTISKRIETYKLYSVLYWNIYEEEMRSMGVTPEDSKNVSLDKIRDFVDDKDFIINYILKTPILEPFPEDFKRELEKLSTYYPTTIITVEDDLPVDIETTYIVDTKNYFDNKFEQANKALVNTQAQLL